VPSSNGHAEDIRVVAARKDKVSGEFDRALPLADFLVDIVHEQKGSAQLGLGRLAYGSFRSNEVQRNYAASKIRPVSRSDGRVSLAGSMTVAKKRPAKESR
jgi:hypothetical protein